MARVSGLGELSHVHLRNQAFNDAMAQRGLKARIVLADFSAEGGRSAARELVLGPEPPTAILFDNDLMAISSLSAMTEAGIVVPDQVSLLAWDDSALCEITHPKLSAMSRDVVGLGVHVGQRVFALLEGEPPAAHLDSKPTFKGRGSTGPPPA
jgi:DNA-binding LacI/PurR family transcriptional regulator